MVREAAGGVRVQFAFSLVIFGLVARDRDTDSDVDDPILKTSPHDKLAYIIYWCKSRCIIGISKKCQAYKTTLFKCVLQRFFDCCRPLVAQLLLLDGYSLIEITTFTSAAQFLCH